MKVIYKYPLEIKHKQRVAMPAGAGILSVQLQDDTICLWALVDPSRGIAHRHFYVFGTGHLIDDRVNANFIGTVQQGSLVWHIFEEAL